MLLCRILPFLIGECVPEEDKHWKCFILLLKIIGIMLSQVISKGQCFLLSLLIEEHHTLFKELYSSESPLIYQQSTSTIPTRQQSSRIIPLIPVLHYPARVVEVSYHPVSHP